jgi:formylglycine-generating enzyme
MTARRSMWASGAVGLAFAVAGCATLLGIEDIPSAADVGADGSTDAGTDSSTGDTGDTGADGPESLSVAAPSCEAGGAGLTNCGDGSESCCTNHPVVSGGTFDRTYTNTGGGPTAKDDPATVASFRLDRYEVTVGRFRQFVSAWNAGWTPPSGSGKHVHLNGGKGLEASGSPGTYETGWGISDDAKISPTNALLACDSYATWTPAPAPDDKRPINCVNWYEAAAFCIWDRGFLPSDAEWVYAAAGGSQERRYPWGDAAPGTGNQYAIFGCNYPDKVGCTGPQKVAPVGTPALGLGAWGQLDLAGNVAEWNLDRQGPFTACVNCSDLATGTRRVIRGSNWSSSDPDVLRPTFRADGEPTLRVGTVGFRCARAP